LRDVMLAAELSAYLQEEAQVYRFLRLGMRNGWTLKNIKNSGLLGTYTNGPAWDDAVSAYDSLHQAYEDGLDHVLRKEVRGMYRRDQWMAMQALFRIGDKQQEEYGEQQFAPHSEKQMALLHGMLLNQGYPGEQLIGNSWWLSTVLSHHNSISKAYLERDVLYPYLRPKLLEAIEKGQLHPNEFMLIEDWREAVRSDHGSTAYGFMGEVPDQKTMDAINRNRDTLGMRSVALRNAMIQLEKEMGMDFQLPRGWGVEEIHIVGQ